MVGGLFQFSGFVTIGIIGTDRPLITVAITGYERSVSLGVAFRKGTQQKFSINIRPESRSNFAAQRLGEAGHEATRAGPDVNRRLVGCFLVSKEAPARCEFTSGPRTWPHVTVLKIGSSWRRR